MHVLAVDAVRHHDRILARRGRAEDVDAQREPVAHLDRDILLEDELEAAAGLRRLDDGLDLARGLRNHVHRS